MQIAQNLIDGENQQGQSPQVNDRPLQTQPTSQVSNGGGGGNFGSVFGLLFVFVLMGVLIYVGLTFWRKKNYQNNKIKNWKKTAFIEVAITKETAEQVQKERAGQSSGDKEMVGIGETLYSIISEYSTDSFKTWLFGAPRFSFEIVSINQEIRFWVVCDTKYAGILEKQLTALYPKASVDRLSKIEFFKPDTVAYCQELTMGNRFEVPFRTYKEIEGDAINSITNAMGGIAKDESLGVQLVLYPIDNKWQDNPRVLATKINQGQNPSTLLWPDKTFMAGFLRFLNGFFGIVFSIFEKKDKDNPLPDKKDRRNMDVSGKYEQIQLTEQQRDIVKKLEDKASKPGFVYALRVVGAAKTKERAKMIVDGVVPSFQIYDIKPLNWITKKKTSNKEAILNFLLRAPNLPSTGLFGENRFDIINTEEANSFWHVPNYLINTPNIKWLTAKKPPIPLEIPGPGGDNVWLGTAKSRGQTKEVFMKTEDRFRHIYSLGGSGSGKSVLMQHIIMQDIKNGHGVCVVDPHGELVDDILLRMPEERVDDVIIFSPAFIDRPLGLNMLEFDPKKPTQKTLVIDTLFAIWDKLYDLKKTGGPMFENYMKNSMRLVMSHPESGSTLMEIAKVLADEDFRSFKLAMCEEQDVVDFWEKEATKAGGEASLENMVPYITSKLAPFVTNDFIKPMVGQQKSAIQFRKAMDNKKIILVKLEKGLIGEMSAYLIGMVVVGNVLMSGMGRNDGLRYNWDDTTTEILASERVPFFIYIDEMQNFLFDAIPKALEEIRKYKVGFYLAHQFVKQVVEQGDERIKDSIMANCASKFIYRCGATDAEMLEKEFAPTFAASDLMMPDKFTCNTVLLIDGQKTTPFNFGPPAPSKDISPDMRKRLIEMTKQKYGKPKEEVEKEIKDRAKLLF
jgi:flagellar basal body-associated protein FliL